MSEDAIRSNTCRFDNAMGDKIIVWLGQTYCIYIWSLDKSDIRKIYGLLK